MAAPIDLKAAKREQLGSRANYRLRKTGQIPGVVYGHHLDVTPIQLEKKGFLIHLNHGAHVFNLALDGKAEPVLVKEVQYDHLSADVIHVDFARVDLNERVTVTVALELKGEPKGEKEGAVLQQLLNELEIECVVTDIPDMITHDVSDMGKDSVLHISDLKLPAGLKVMQDADQLVATCREIMESAEDIAADAAADAAGEPEVITKGKEDEAAAAAEEAK